MPVLAAVGALGIILTAVYLLRAILNITFGEAHREWAGTTDFRPLEYLPAVVLTAFIVLIGVYPNVLGERLQATIEILMHGIGG
jgi:NADH-quinone oxidoreductase subunit M